MHCIAGMVENDQAKMKSVCSVNGDIRRCGHSLPENIQFSCDHYLLDIQISSCSMCIIIARRRIVVSFKTNVIT